LPVQDLIHFGQYPIPVTLVHAVTHSGVDTVGYRTNVRAMALNIAQDDTCERVVPTDSDVADIATFGAVGSAAVNADC